MTSRLDDLRAMRAFLDREIQAELGANNIDVDPAAIVEAVAKLFDIPASRILARGRDYRTALARHSAAWMLKRSGLTHGEISDVLGYRDNTTAGYACRRIDRDPAARALLRGLEVGG